MTTRKPIVVISGQMQENPAGDLLLGCGLVQESVAAGQTATVPSGYQYQVHGQFDVSGTLALDGKLVLP